MSINVESVSGKKELRIDASGLHYRDLNRQIREAVRGGVGRIELLNVYGQRYIGTNVEGGVEIEITGTPGNDLAAFMNGPRIVVYGNVQDGCGNTMNEGEVVVRGHAGDIIGYSMRGGRIYIREGVGYRAGIHMKEYKEKKPLLVIGGSAQDFLGEYMAGGAILLLGLGLEGEHPRHKTRFMGTGMHGGVIYVRGEMEEVSPEVKHHTLTESDRNFVGGVVEDFAKHFDLEPNKILEGEFSKLTPLSSRPYGNIYAY